MEMGHHFWERLADRAELETESMPGVPLVEIIGTGRVLIENHRGVKAYSREKIVIGTKSGCVSVCGCSLELMRMSKERLIICGRIDAVHLERGR